MKSARYFLEQNTIFGLFETTLNKGSFVVKMLEFSTAKEAVKLIKSGDRVFLHTAAATPMKLINAMTDRYQDLRC